MTINLAVPSRKVPTPATTGLRPARVQPSSARRVGQEAQRLGAALRSLGGTFGDIVDKVERSQTRTEVAEDQLGHAEDERVFLEALDKDQDFAGRAEKYSIWADEQAKTRTEGLKSEGARSHQTRWHRQRKNKTLTDVTLEAGRRAVVKEGAILDLAVAEAVKSGDFTDAVTQAEAMIEDDNLIAEVWELRLNAAIEERKKLVNKQIYAAAFNSLLAELTIAGGGRAGLKAVDSWLAEPENTEGLQPGDSTKLKRAMILENDIVKIQVRKASAAETKETILGLSEIYLKDSRVDLPTIEAGISNVDLKDRWRAIQKNQAKTPDETKEWLANITLQDSIIEYLLGTDPFLTEEEMLTQIIEGATTHQQIAEKEMNELVTMMKLPFNRSQLINLQASFKRIRDEENRFLTRISDSEAKRISANRYAEIEMMADRKSRKKEDTTAEVYQRGLEIDVASRSVVEGIATAFLGPRLTSALTGELGTLARPDGGFSTEISITVTDEQLNNGQPTNIPTLVQGQVGVDALLAGQPVTDEQQEIAINRAIARVGSGADLPSFGTIAEAVKAAQARSDAKGKPTKPDEQTLADAVGTKNAKMEMTAWGVIFDTWNSFPRRLQTAIRTALQQGISYTEILQFDEVDVALKRLTK